MWCLALKSNRLCLALIYVRDWALNKVAEIPMKGSWVSSIGVSFFVFFMVFVVAFWGVVVAVLEKGEVDMGMVNFLSDFYFISNSHCMYS